MEKKSGICKARFSEGGVNAICMAVFLSLGVLEVGGDCCAQKEVIGSYLVVNETSRCRFVYLL